MKKCLYCGQEVEDSALLCHNCGKSPRSRSDLKIRHNKYDTFCYCLFCILTLGSLWVIRLLISAAIRHAFTNDEEENV